MDLLPSKIVPLQQSTFDVNTAARVWEMLLPLCKYYSLLKAAEWWLEKDSATSISQVAENFKQIKNCKFSFSAFFPEYASRTAWWEAPNTHYTALLPF